MNKKQAIDFIKLKLEGSVFKPYVKSLAELTSFANEETINLYEEDLYQFMYGYNVSLSKLIENIKDNDNAVSILETIIYTMVNTEIKTIEEFLPFSRFKKEFKIIKDISFKKDFESLKIDYNSLNINNFSIYETLLENLSGLFGHYNYGRFSSLDKVIENYYKAYLFLKNFNYYSIYGKYAAELKQLKNSFYEPKSKYNSNIPALKDMYEYLTVDLPKPELLKSINSAFKNKLDRKLNYEEISFSNKFNDPEDPYPNLNWIIDQDRSFYKFSVEKTTPTFYFLKRENLSFTKQDSEGNFKNNLVDYFRMSYKIRRSQVKDFTLNIGDNVVVIGQGSYGSHKYSIPESEFDRSSKEIFKLGHIDSLSEEENYNVTDYFTKRLSDIFLKNIKDINSDLTQSIEKLTEEYESIPLPTHEELLYWLKDLKKISYNPNYSERENYQGLTGNLLDNLKVKDREKIGVKLREDKSLLAGSEEISLSANKFSKEFSELLLSDREEKAVKHILELYYDKDSGQIKFEFQFYFDRENMDHSIKKEKLKILKTKFELSDFEI